MLKSPKDVLKKSYLKEKLIDSEFAQFKEAIDKFQSKTLESAPEEYNKNVLIEFLNSIGYKDYKVNIKDRIDLAIYNKNNIPEVIIESKKPNKKSEMISIDNLNKKAFHEAMLYFLREKHKEKNFDIRHVIITDNIEWFIFDASEFNKVASNRLVEKLYIDKEIKPNLFSDKNPEFYKYLEELLKDGELLKNIDYARFYLKDRQTKTQLKNIYKLLSPRHLLKQYVESDSNTLNTKFYDELLYIL